MDWGSSDNLLGVTARWCNLSSEINIQENYSEVPHNLHVISRCRPVIVLAFISDTNYYSAHMTVRLWSLDDLSHSVQSLKILRIIKTINSWLLTGFSLPWESRPYYQLFIPPRTHNKSFVKLKANIFHDLHFRFDLEILQMIRYCYEMFIVLILCYGGMWRLWESSGHGHFLETDWGFICIVLVVWGFTVHGFWV